MGKNLLKRTNWNQLKRNFEPWLSDHFLYWKHDYERKWSAWRPSATRWPLIDKKKCSKLTKFREAELLGDKKLGIITLCLKSQINSLFLCLGLVQWRWVSRPEASLAAFERPKFHTIRIMIPTYKEPIEVVAGTLHEVTHMDIPPGLLVLSNINFSFYNTGRQDTETAVSETSVYPGLWDFQIFRPLPRTEIKVPIPTST